MASAFRPLHESIRRGRAAEAAAALRRIARRGVPAAHRAEFANLAWRAGLADVGARVLCPIVRGAGRHPASARPAEIAEYAACLIRLDASEEALVLLEGLGGRATKQATLYEAYAHITRWNYARAIPLLGAYLRDARPEPYERLVARVNLASALVYERRHVDAEALLRELLHEASVKKLALALGVVLELSASHFVLQGKLHRAGPLLERGEKELAGADPVVRFLVRKWQGILRYLETKGRDAAALDAIRREAASRAQWETIRDCDRVEAVTARNEELLLKLFFGTPYETFREKLVREAGPLAIPSSLVWDLGTGRGRAASVDLTTGETASAGALRPGSVAYRLLRCLASDFYRPFRVAALYAHAYEGAYFNPETSPGQLHVGVRRLRRWLAAGRIPLDVVEAGGAYRLVATGRVELSVPRPDATDLDPPLVGRLRAALAASAFSVHDAARALAVSRRSAQRLLAEAEAQGRLARLGRGRSTRYEWVTVRHTTIG